MNSRSGADYTFIGGPYPYFNQYCDAKDDTEDSDHVQVVVDVPMRMSTRKHKPRSTVETVITPMRPHVSEASPLYTID